MALNPLRVFLPHLALALYLAFGIQDARGQRPPPVILISFDGFRWDYADLAPTPHLDQLMAAGFQVEKMRPSDPTLTFPNHYTLVTGVHPNRHGLVGNRMYDEATGAHYDKREPSHVADPQWYLAPNLWDFAREHGLETAAYFWVGSEIEGRQPDYFFPYRDGVPHEVKIKKFQTWLMLDTPPNPSFISLYFSIIDDAGHYFGPGSPRMLEYIQEADRLVGEVMSIMSRSGRNPNLVIVSDHGMTAVKPEAVSLVEIRQSLGDIPIAALVENFSQVDLFLQKPTREDLHTALVRLPKRDYLEWFVRDDHPGRFHPSRNGHLIGLMRPGAYISDGDTPPKGGHGYTSESAEMAAICMGMGPGIVAGSRLAEVRSVDVLPLLLHLLGLPQRDVDGRLAVWSPVLIKSPGLEPSHE